MKIKPGTLAFKSTESKEISQYFFMSDNTGNKGNQHDQGSKTRNQTSNEYRNTKQLKMKKIEKLTALGSGEF